MNLPAAFVHTVETIFATRGSDWLKRLPALIEEASTRWGLRDVQAVENLSYNFVAYARCESTAVQAGNVVLKIGVPNPELTSEMNALKIFGGKGACRLLDCDEENGLMLIERLMPGKMLAELEDDDERTQIAMDVMLNRLELNGSAPALQSGFIKLADWFAELSEVRSKFAGGTGPIPEKIFRRVEDSLPGLFAEEDACLLHGDFHHYNILSAERGWLVIDPKGVIGPAGYEIGPLMLNPMVSSLDGTRFKVQTLRRVDIIRERMGWAREKIIGWALAHSVLSAVWDLELEPAFVVEAAKIIATLK